MQIYRPLSSYVWGWLSVSLGAAVALAQIATTGWAHAHVGIGLGVALAGCGIAAFLLPAVLFGDHVVEVRNVVQTTTIPYARLEAIEAKWTVELLGDDGKRVGVMAAPARSSRERSAGATAPTPEIVQVIEAARDDWRRRCVTGEATRADSAEQGPAFVRRVYVPGLLVVLVTVSAALVALFL